MKNSKNLKNNVKNNCLFTASFVYIGFITMAGKTIFSDCLNKINTVAKTLKPLVFLSLKQKKKSNHF